jgi:large subunit ribosomal protein L18
MASKPTYSVKYRRRREGKTDYQSRLKKLSGGKPLLVVRVLNKKVVVEVMQYSPKGDKTLVYTDSQELSKKYGWKGHGGNTPSAYLTGYLCGLKAVKQNIKKAYADTGLHAKVKGASIFAAIKGAIDAGLEIPHNESVFPKEERIKGTHINEQVSKNFDVVMKKVKVRKSRKQRNQLRKNLRKRSQLRKKLKK